MSTTTPGPNIDALSAAVARVVPEPTITKRANDRTQTFTVKLGGWTYPLAWTGIYGLHIACAAYCFVAGLLFLKMQHTATVWYLDCYQNTVPSKYARTIANFHFVLGAVHCGFLALAMVRFIYTNILRVRKWCRRQAVVEPSDRTTSTFLNRVSSAIPQTLERRIPRQLRTPVAFVYKHVFGRKGLFGVEFWYADSFFLIREIVETILQSHQAYQMCQLLTRPALNRFFVATLVVNCWATPVLHHFVPNKALQRLLVRICDVVLDFLASVGVPVILTANYVKYYDPTFKDFPYELWYDDKWFVTALKESPLIMFGSWIDALGRLTFSIGLIASLDDIKLLLKRAPVSTTSGMTEAKRKSTKKATPQWYNAEHSRVITIAHRLMFLYGFVVLAVQLQAELRQRPTESCLLEVRPWLATKPTCSLVEINCWRNRDLTGGAEDFERHIGRLDALALTQLTVRHCPHVEIQPSIQHFKNMLGMKIYNSTIVAWEDDAALRQVYHANMRYAFFARTNFSNGTFPPGFISPEYPLLLQDVELSITNIRWIPDDLDKRWPPLINLLLEFSELTEYPLPFARGRFDSVLVIGNKITHFPIEMFEAPGQRLLNFAANPVNELPADVNASRVQLHDIIFDGTNISSVPPWILEWVMLPTAGTITGTRTPWCNEVVLKFNESEKAATPWFKRVICNDPPTSGKYPLSVEVRPEEIW